MGVVMHESVGEWVDVCVAVGGVSLVWLVSGRGVVWLCVVALCGDVRGCIVYRGRG